MKVKVTLYASGKTFTEVVTVADIKDAKSTALARNPHAKIVSVNPVL